MAGRFTIYQYQDSGFASVSCCVPGEISNFQVQGAPQVEVEVEVEVKGAPQLPKRGHCWAPGSTFRSFLLQENWIIEVNCKNDDQHPMVTMMTNKEPKTKNLFSGPDVKVTTN